jgi:hypothetical protein
MRKMLLNGVAVVAAALVLSVASSAYAQVNVSWSVPYSSGSVVVPSAPVVVNAPVVYSSYSYSPAVVTYRRPLLARPVIARTVVAPTVVSRAVVTTPVVSSTVVASPVVSTSYYAPVAAPVVAPTTVYYGGVNVSAPFTRVMAAPSGVYVNTPWSNVIVGRPF